MTTFSQTRLTAKRLRGRLSFLHARGLIDCSTLNLHIT